MNETRKLGRFEESHAEFLQHWGKDKGTLQLCHDQFLMEARQSLDSFVYDFVQDLSDVLQMAIYALQMQEDFSAIQKEMKSGEYPAPNDPRFMRWIGWDGYKAPEQQYEEFGHYRREFRQKLLGVI